MASYLCEVEDYHVNWFPGFERQQIIGALKPYTVSFVGSRPIGCSNIAAPKGLRTKLDEVTVSQLPNSVYRDYTAAIEHRRMANVFYPDTSYWQNRMSMALYYIMSANVAKRRLQGGC
jgi:hypothetical protein